MKKTIITLFAAALVLPAVADDKGFEKIFDGVNARMLAELKFSFSFFGIHCLRQKYTPLQKIYLKKKILKMKILKKKTILKI